MTGFDVIVVGAGSAGATLASLLSRASSRRVCLVEAGDDYRSEATPDAIRGPNFQMALQAGRYHWHELQAKYTEQQAPNAYIAGRGVGGSSAINAQGAVRGLPGDFDNWVGRGCVGWSWDEVLPAFVRLESDADFGDRPYHGAHGPIPVMREDRAHWGAVSNALALAARELGYPENGDVNAPDAFGLSPIPWNRRRGARVSTNDAYLEPARAHANLTVKAGSLVDRLRFEGSRVTGVVLQRSDAAGEEIVEAPEVILCAGAFHSPSILLRSGVGPADELRRLGVKVIADRPGVGRGLQDHPMVWLTFPLSEQSRAASADVLPSACVLRVGAERGTLPGSIEILPLERTPMDTTRGGFMISWMRPSSRGTLRLSSLDPRREPEVALGMLSTRADLQGLREATRCASVLADAGPLAKLMDSGLSLSPTEQIRDVGDEQLERWLLDNCMPYFHAGGTCQMGSPEDPATVVDPACRVLGTQGLRVVDASVFPVLPAAPTHLTTVMMAEHLFRRHLS